MLDLWLFGLGDWEFFARVRLGDQIVLSSLVLHDARQRLLVPDVQLQSEVLGHQVVLPSAEIASDYKHQVFLCQRLCVALPLVDDLANRKPTYNTWIRLRAIVVEYLLDFN